MTERALVGIHQRNRILAQQIRSGELTSEQAVARALDQAREADAAVRRDNVHAEDSVVVGLLKDAGAIVVGKGNTPTLAMDLQTDNPLFGRTNNPWDVGRTSGGSTGGDTVAVAAGMAALGPVARVMTFLSRQREFIPRMENFLDSYDVWLCPVSSTTAFGHLKPSGHFGDFSGYNEPLLVDGVGR